jgi:hypothetical protein
MDPARCKAPGNDLAWHGLRQNMASSMIKPFARKAQLLQQRLVMGPSSE